MAKGKSVGYRNPPEKGRFKPGKSGNPHGRPKGSMNLTTALARELGEKIIIRENGKTRRLSKQEALLKAIVARALQGDIKAASTVLTLSSRLLDEREDIHDNRISQEELAILRRYVPQLVVRKSRQ